MNYFIDKTTGELKQGYSAFKNWVPLPKNYQDKIFEDIVATKWDRLIIICHSQLKPQVLRFREDIWSEMDSLKIGTQALLRDGRLSFHEPRPTPTEQRDAFQKNYPHLVKNFYPKTSLKTNEGQDVSPEHYCKGKIEPWDFIASQGLNFFEGNIVKYITRYRHKDGLKDLYKARTYLNKLISEVECSRK